MHLYHLTVQPPTSITHILVGSFTGTPKQQEICLIRGDRFLELVRVNAQTGKLEQVVSSASLSGEESSFSFGGVQPVFGTIRSVAVLRLPGESNRDFLVIGSDAGGSAVLTVRQDAGSGLLRWERVIDHLHGRSGSRRDVPGQFVAVDPRGRALLTAALDSRKFAHTVSRERDSLRLSSPLEAHRPGHLCEALVAVDAGVEHHPAFAAIEVDYGEADEAQAQQPKTPLEGHQVLKQLVYYELDQGLNQIVRKWSEPLPEDATGLLAVPGGSDGPGGVVVLGLSELQYRRPQRPVVSLSLPSQLSGSFVTATCLVKVKNVFFFLLQFESGDLFKLSLTPEQLHLQMRYFDTIPMASGLAVLRSGFLFAASQAGPSHALYRIVGLADGEGVTQYCSDTVNDQPYERNESLTNLSLVDSLPHWGPVTDARIVNLSGEETPQIYTAHAESAGAASLSISRWGMALEELVSTELPSEFGAIRGVWKLPSDEHRLLVSFAECSFVLSVDLESGEVGQVDVESDSFASQLRLESNLFAGSLGKGALGRQEAFSNFTLGDAAFIQGFKDGFNLISKKDNSLREWRPAQGTFIVAAAFNARQIFLSLSSQELVSLSFDPSTGAHQEHPEAVTEEFPLQITCLAVAPLLEGRKTTRWLVAGTSEDQAIRVLDTESGMEVAAIQALTGAPTHLALIRDSLGALILHVAVEGGIWIRFHVDESSGALQHPTSRFIGPCDEPCFCSLSANSMLALGARPWLETYDKLGRPVNAPLFFSQIAAACAFEDAAFAAVDTDGNLRILKIVPGSSSSPFYRQRLDLPAESGAVKKFAVHPETGLIAVISAGGVSLVDAQGSRVGLAVQYHENECALAGCFVRFHDRLEENFLAVAGARDFSACPRLARGGSFIDLFPIDPQTGVLGARVHRTELESTGAPAVIASFNGRLLVGVDLDLRMYDLGRARLLRKTQARLPSPAVTIRSQGLRLWIGTAKHSHNLLVYRPDTNSFFAVADDPLPRAITADCVLDYESVAGADRFGNVFVDRLPVAASEALDSERHFASLNGSNEKLERLVEFFVNDTIVALQRVSWAGEAGREAIWYVSVSGAVGCFVPLPTRSAASAAVDLQSTLRALTFDTDPLNKQAAPLTDLLHRSHLSYQSTFAPGKGVVDGDFVEQFLRLPVQLQHSIATRLDKTLAELKKQIEESRRLMGM